MAVGERRRTGLSKPGRLTLTFVGASQAVSMGIGRFAGLETVARALARCAQTLQQCAIVLGEIFLLQRPSSVTEK